jgi:hypothetical protein
MKKEIKTAEEILSNYCTDFQDGRTYSDSDIIDAMKEYADQFKQKWISVKDRLPEVKESTGMVWENKDLVLIKWLNHDSIEIAVLTRIKRGIIWEIPNQGHAELSEVLEWMQIPE